eukprot:403343892
MSTITLKNSNISNLANQDSTQAFIDCILLYSKNLEADAVSIELQDLFFKLSESRNQLPSNASNNLIDSFLASLVSIISINPEYKLSIRAIQILFNYLKNDPKVFKRFKPNKVIIKNMNMSTYVLSQNFKDQELALDFCAFLLRYHKDIDYSDFSDDQFVVNKIRRAEIYRSWADIEDLANGYETINANFEKHRTVTSNAFQEIVKLVEKVKGECIQIATQGIPLGGNTQSEGEFRRDISGLKNQVTNLQNQLSANQNDQTRFNNFQTNVQNDLNRMNEQQLQFDNNLKLLAEGTLSLSEKEKQFALKVEIMRKDLSNMANSIETRLDTKLSSVETGQKVSASTIENQVESGFKRFNDQLTILEKRMLTQMDEKVFDSRKQNADSFTKNLDTMKFDYESLINRLGSQIQELISRLKQETTNNIANVKRESEDKVWQLRTDTEDMLKTSKISIQEDSLKFKEEVRQRLDDSELRTHKEFSKLLDDTTQAIEDSINTNLIGQMKELDTGLKDVTNRANNLDQAVHLQTEKVQKIEDSLNDHIDLIESLNKKLDKQAQVIEDNKGMIIEKLGIFEAGVINELKEATSHFSFKAYEESFRKIETDMDTFYKELLKMREDFDVKNTDLADWKQKLGQDLLNFYKKYDGQFADTSNLGKMERDSLNVTINEVTDNLAKNRQSIQLLAKESKEAFENMRDEIDRLEQKNEESITHSQNELIQIKNKLREITLEQTLLKQLVQSRDATSLKTSILDEIMKSNNENFSQNFNLVDSTRPSSLVNKASYAKNNSLDSWLDIGNMLSSAVLNQSGDLNNTNNGLRVLIINQLQKTLEEFDRILRIKFNEQKLMVNNELNAQAQLSLKMMEEFRNRMNDFELVQSNLAIKNDDLARLYSGLNAKSISPFQQQQTPRQNVALISSQNRDMFDLKDQPMSAKSGIDNVLFERLRSDFDNFVIYVQKFIEEHLNILARIVRADYKTIEDKMDTIEWAVRNADFISNDEIQKFFLVFRELYASPDPELRNSYIQANHQNDSILTIIDILQRDFNKLDFQFQNKEMRMGTEKKVIVVLGALEALIVNDKNLSMALEADILQLLIKILKSQTIRNTPVNQIAIYIKFALRCLTSAIRTEPAVNRFYQIDGGVSKVLEILEYVDDQELIANSCKIVRICLRDEIVYDKMALQYAGLANLIIEKMVKWSNSLPIIQESSKA